MVFYCVIESNYIHTQTETEWLAHTRSFLIKAIWIPCVWAFCVVFAKCSNWPLSACWLLRVSATKKWVFSFRLAKELRSVNASRRRSISEWISNEIQARRHRQQNWYSTVGKMEICRPNVTWILLNHWLFHRPVSGRFGAGKFGVCALLMRS